MSARILSLLGVALVGAFFVTLWYTTSSARPGGLILNEQDSGPVVWEESDANVTGGAVAPDGTKTAAQFIESARENAYHYVSQTISKPPSAITYVITVYVKSNGRDVTLRVASGRNNGAVYAVASDNGRELIRGVYGTGFTLESASAERAPEGYFKLSMVITTDSSSSIYFELSSVISNKGTNIYIGDGKSGFYWWELKLDRASDRTP
jgi:hypothetical protein